LPSVRFPVPRKPLKIKEPQNETAQNGAEMVPESPKKKQKQRWEAEILKSTT